MQYVYLTAEQMTLVDKVAVEKYHLEIKQMMENAGRNVARWIVDNLSPKKVVCLYGKGNNGGDALCCARFLRIYGVKDVNIVPAFEGSGNSEVEHQLNILKESGLVPDVEIGRLAEGDVIVDGLLGYNITGNPKGRFADLISESNKLRGRKGVKVVSYDIPSGMNPDNGSKYLFTIGADYTITLALPKMGLKNADCGKLFLANIGIPNELYKKELGMNISNYFKYGDVVEVK
jgi:NAD(P)H-hydrate epimerase